MKASTKQVRVMLSRQSDSLQDLRHDFILRSIPRLHRLLMEKFPQARDWFGYGLAANEDDPRKLTLLRGKKVIARNFTL